MGSNKLVSSLRTTILAIWVCFRIQHPTPPKAKERGFLFGTTQMGRLAKWFGVERTGQPEFLMFTGEIFIPGVLRWCEMNSIRPPYLSKL